MKFDQFLRIISLSSYTMQTFNRIQDGSRHSKWVVWRTINKYIVYFVCETTYIRHKCHCKESLVC